MMAVSHLVQLGNVEQARKFVEVEHRIVLAVFAKERDVLTQVHIL